MWNIKRYLAPNENCPFQDWYEDLDEDVQATLRTRLEYLCQQPKERWRPPYFRDLKGACKGLGELRFKVRNVQYRPIGFFGPQAKEFTFLIGAIEKGGQLKPKCEVALKYKTDVLDKGYCDDWEY